MPQYNDPNMALANQIGGSLAKLFAPPDHAKQIKYLEGASSAARDQAAGRRYDAAGALDTQTYGNRAAFTPEAVGAAMPGTDSPMAALIAHSLGQGGNAEQAIGGLNAAMGGQRIANAQNEGDARTGFALTGHSSAATAPLTGGGVSDLFGQQSSLNDADNATRLAQTGVTAAASRYGSDQSAAASRYGSDRRYAATTEGNAADIAAGRWNGKNGAAGASTNLKVGDYAKLSDDIAKNVPGAPPDAIAETAQRAGVYIQNGQSVPEAQRQAIADVFGQDAAPQPETKFVDTWGPGGEQQPVLDKNGQPVSSYVPRPRDQWPAFPQVGGAAPAVGAQPQGGDMASLFKQVLPAIMDIMGKPGGAAPAEAPAAAKIPKLGRDQWQSAIEEGNKAIAGGADPAAVKQRLAEAGVQLQEQ